MGKEGQWMDAGLALFCAPDAAEARARVLAALHLPQGETMDNAGKWVLDCSTPCWRRKVEASLSATSLPDTYALSLRVAERFRLLPFDLPSKTLARKVHALVQSLASL